MAKKTGKSWAQLAREQAERVRGDLNPMKRPEVAAKVSASAKQRMADPEVRAAFVAAGGKASRTPELNAQRRVKLQAYWTEERKEAARLRQMAYQAKVKAALAVMGESQHGTNTAT